MSHSADLQFELLRHGGRFYVVRNGMRFSCDPFNNSGKYTRRHCGIINDKAAVVKVKGEKQIYITTKDGSCANKPREMFKKQVFPVDAKASAVSKAVAEVRPDLADIAFRRARKFARLMHRTKKIRAARKEHVANVAAKLKKPKRKATRQAKKH